MTGLRDKISNKLLPFSDGGGATDDMADAVLAILPGYEAQQARIDELERVLNEAETLLSELRAKPVRVDRLFALFGKPADALGCHRVTCNPDGTEPTVTWEPSQ